MIFTLINILIIILGCVFIVLLIISYEENAKLKVENADLHVILEAYQEVLQGGGPDFNPENSKIGILVEEEEEEL